jgi:hypothetical protein
VTKKKKRRAIDFAALGRKSTPAKRRAARRVGKLYGGRKPKFNPGDRAMANDQAQLAYRGRVGTIVAAGPGRAQFRVRFGDRDGLLMSWWLDPV